MFPTPQAFQILGKFILGLSNFPIKILRRYKILILPFVVFLQQCPILWSLLKNLSFFPCLFLRYCLHRKDGKRFSGFLFGDSLSVTLYIRQNAYIVADCKWLTERKDKIGNDFSGFSKCSDLISGQVKRKQFWLLNNRSAFFAAMYTGLPYTDKDKQTIFRKCLKIFLLTKYSDWFSL